MKTYSAFVEFFEYKHCKKVVSNIQITFRTKSELLNKVSKIKKETGLKLLHNYPLAPYKNSNAFSDLPE